MKLTCMAFVSRRWFSSPIVQHFARRARFLTEVAWEHACASIAGRSEHRSRVGGRLLHAGVAGSALLAPPGSSDKQDSAGVVELGSPIRILGRAWMGRLCCTVALGAAAVVNAQTAKDPRIGTWTEEKSSTNYESIRRVVQAAPNGMTRMIINAKLGEDQQNHVDFKCDGKPYPVVSGGDRPAGMTYSCRVTGAHTVSSVLRPVNAAPGVETTVSEVVSKDGNTLTMSISSRSAKGVQTSQRNFTRTAQ